MPTTGRARTLLPSFAVLLSLGCNDFEADYAACVDAGRCARRPAPVPDGGHRGCTDAYNPGNQAFGPGAVGPESYELFGCAGAVGYPDRTGLCNTDAGCFSCGAPYWAGRTNKQPAPSADYWTNDSLGLASGTSNACSIDYINNATACTEADGGLPSPMRVCAQTGSACAVTGCGFQTTSGDFFGGCGSLAVAGALCACN